MLDPQVIIEGDAKYRDNRRWRSRWCVLTKLSPAADCLHLQVYKDSKVRYKKGPTKASLALENIVGIESGFTMDKESNTLAIICRNMVLTLAFDSREALIQWQVKLGLHVPEEQLFLVQITRLPSKSKLTCGPARLHVRDLSFAIVTGLPPKLAGVWQFSELRRYGIVDGKFCFEGGSSCGKGEGLHVIHTNQNDEVMRAFKSASLGELHAKKRTSIKESQIWSPQNRQSRHRDSDSKLHDRCCSNSGSEGSNCDSCSEIIRVSCCSTHDDLDCLMEENYAPTTNCSTLKWSSDSSCSSGTYMASQSIRSVPVDSVNSNTLAAIQSHNGNCKAINIIPNDSSFLSAKDFLIWALPKCNHCVSQTCCLGPSICECEANISVVESASLSFTTDGIKMTASKGQGDSPGLVQGSAISKGTALLSPNISRSNFPSCLLKHHMHQHHNIPHNYVHHHTHVHVHGKNQEGNIHSDRTSLCSSSSRSSGASSNNSNGENQSNCEYSVPRSNHEGPTQASWYDQPRKLHQIIGVDNWRAGKLSVCTCKTSNSQKDQVSKVPYKKLNESHNYVNCNFQTLPKNWALGGSMDKVANHIVNGHYQVPRNILANVIQHGFDSKRRSPIRNSWQGQRKLTGNTATNFAIWTRGLGEYRLKIRDGFHVQNGKKVQRARYVVGRMMNMNLKIFIFNLK